MEEYGVHKLDEHSWVREHQTLSDKRAHSSSPLDLPTWASLQSDHELSHKSRHCQAAK